MSTNLKGGDKLSTTKTIASERIISIDADSLQVLKEYRRSIAPVVSNENNIVFFGQKLDRPLSQQTLDQTITRYTKAAGLPHVTPHGLRHTHATMLLDAGVTLSDAKERLGHKSIQTTIDIYTHSNTKSTQITDRLKAHFEGNT